MASAGSGAPQTAEITATASAPASITRATLSSVMPGHEEARRRLDAVMAERGDPAPGRPLTRPANPL